MSKKQEKAKKRRKKYVKRRNVNRQLRRKIIKEGVDLTLPEIARYCKECVHSKKNKATPGAYYCDIFDEEYKDGVTIGWGEFEGNRLGTCDSFKKKLKLRIRQWMSFKSKSKI